MEDSDSDSFDVVNDEDIGGYNPIGEINPNTRRIVVKGSNKSYYGVGPKPVATCDTKSRGKVSAKGPSPGDIGKYYFLVLKMLITRTIYVLGFFKLTLLNSPMAYNDGERSVQVKYDYCSFNSG